MIEETQSIMLKRRLVFSKLKLSHVIVFHIFVVMGFIACEKNDSFEYFDCHSIFGDSTSIDSLSVDILSNAMSFTFISNTASIGSTKDVFIQKEELIETVDSSNQFLPYYLELIKSLKEYPEMFDDLNNSNYRTNKSFTRFYGFLAHIQENEWFCLMENYDQEKDLIRATNILLDNEELKTVSMVQPSLPGYSSDSLHALVYLFYYDLTSNSPRDENSVLVFFSREDLNSAFEVSASIYYKSM